MSLFLNMLFRFVITFLSRSKCPLISWLQSQSAVIFGTKENKVCLCFQCLSIYLPLSDGTGCQDLCFLNVEFYASFFTLLFNFHQKALQFLFTFCHKGGVICKSEVISISPCKPDSSLFFLHTIISHDVPCIEVK